MSWKHLTSEDLKLVLSQDEINKLEERSVDLADVLDKQLDTVADLFRGAFRSKGYTIDERDHYIPDSYVQYVLDYARYSIFTRFPMANEYALSEPRKLLFEQASEILKNPFIKPDDPVDPDDPDDPDSEKRDNAITLPYLKMNDPYSGFMSNFQYRNKL